MPILNNTNDGFANIMILLAKFILNHGPQKKDYLLSIFNIGVEDKYKYIRSTLNRWIELDLFKQENDEISFSDTAQNIFGVINEKNLITIIRRITFLKKNNPKLLVSKKNFAGDFSTGAAWLLSQPLNLEIKENFKRMASQITDENKRPVSNSGRFDRLLEYMKILGLISGYSNNYLIIDPSKAIKDELSHIFGNNKILPIQNFLDNLANLIPVLDFGSYRKEIDNYLRTDVLKKTDNLELSPSLSFALFRLDQSRKISLENRGDADKAFQFSNSFKNSTQISSFTHINFSGN